MKMKITNHTRHIKGTALSLIAATFLLSGCGSNGIDDIYDTRGEEITQTDYTVHVVDDNVLGSRIISNECSGYEEKSDGYYTLTGCSSRPKAIIAEGGYITLGDTNVTMGFPLMLNANMVKQSTSYTATPLTTLLATVNDYDELYQLKQALGFEKVEDMFEDTEEARELQRTLNSFFIEAKESGIDLNNFSDFTKDFREMVTKATGANKLEVLKNAKTKLKEEFDKNPDKYLDKYGVVFSGFVTSTDYTAENGATELLKNISRKFNGDEDQIVFSGFIFDDIIGSANSKYNDDANITITDLKKNTYLSLNDQNVTWLKADKYGQYILKINTSDIINENSYLLKGTVTNIENKKIVLNSILTGGELRSKFKAKINTSDIPDLTISNVTTAKVAILEKKGVDLNDTTQVIEQKKLVEEEKSTLLNVATLIKTIIDGSTNTTTSTQNTFEYAKTTIATNGTFTQPTTIDTTQFNSFKTKIETNKTLVSQLTSTTYTKFKIPKDKLLNQRLVVSVTGETYPITILLFTDGSYSLDTKDNNRNPKFEVGKWDVDSLGDLTLTNTENGIVSKISLDKIEIAKATLDSYGNLTGSTPNPKGSLKIGTNESQLINVTILTPIDLNKNKAPLVEFTYDNIKNKKLFEVYEGSEEYEDAVYTFSVDGKNATYSEDVKNETDKVEKAVSITNGIITIGNDTFKIKKSYATKLICTKNGNTSEDTELFYNEIDAAASKEIRTYDNPTYVKDRFGTTYWSVNSKDNNNPNINEASIDSSFFKLKTNPLSNDVTNYNKSTVGIASTHFNSTKVIGTKTALAITKNLGDSARQRATVSTRYWLPACDGTLNQGQLLVDVQLRYNKVVYNLKVRDTAGVDHDILDTPITILEENTLNKTYTALTLIKDNKLTIQVTDGVNAYYQYVDLESLWSVKPTNLKSFQYPTSLRNSFISTTLYDDGTGKLYKGKMNTPIEAQISSFKTVDGKNDNSYKGGVSSVCSAASNSEGSTAAPIPTTPPATIASLENDLEARSLSDFSPWTLMDTNTYNSLQPIASTFFDNTFGDVWYEADLPDYKYLEKTVHSVSSSNNTITFSEYEKEYQNGEYRTPLSKTNTYQISKSGNVYTIVDTTVEGDKEVKIIKEYNSNALKSLFNAKGLSTIASLFDTDDKAVFSAVKQLEDGLSFHEAERDHESNNTAYKTLVQLISTQSGSRYLIEKDETEDTGIAFATGSTGNSGTLIETSYNSSRNAGTWQIGSDNILRVNITIDGYESSRKNYTIWKEIDGVVMRGEELKTGDSYGGLFFNESALTKLYNYFDGIYTSPTAFTYEMIAGNTFYEVYFDDGDPYQTTTNKNIGKFVMNADGNFTAYQLLGNNVGHTASGTWSVEDGKLKTSVTRYNGEAVAPYNSANTIETTINGAIRTVWVDDNNPSETGINYYFYELLDANSFGYSTTASDTTTIYHLEESDIAGYVIRVSSTETSRNKIYYEDGTFSTESSSTSDEGTWSIVNGRLEHNWKSGGTEVHSFNVKPAVGTTLTNETYNVSGTILEYNSIQ